MHGMEISRSLIIIDRRLLFDLCKDQCRTSFYPIIHGQIKVQSVFYFFWSNSQFYAQKYSFLDNFLSWKETASRFFSRVVWNTKKTEDTNLYSY